MDEARLDEARFPMAMLPNDHHPGPGCSCADCLRAWPEPKAERLTVHGIPYEEHPDWNTPNWCDTCTPKGFGCCRCEIACNE